MAFRHSTIENLDFFFGNKRKKNTPKKKERKAGNDRGHVMLYKTKNVVPGESFGLALLFSSSLVTHLVNLQLKWPTKK